MATPISGDKISTPYDAKLTRQESRSGSAQASSTPSASPASSDSLQLSQAAAERPLSEAIGSQEQARQALASLLQAMQANPQQAAAAQGAVSETFTDAVLSSSAN